MGKYSVFDPAIGAFREVSEANAIKYVQEAEKVKAKLIAAGVLPQ